LDFFEIDPLGTNYNYYAVRVQESDFGLLGSLIFDTPGISVTDEWGDIISRYMVSEGKVNRKYQPLLATSRLITRGNRTLISVPSYIVELYSYDDKGNITDYMLTAKHMGVVRAIENNMVDGAVVRRKRIQRRWFGLLGLRLVDDLIEIRIQKDGYELTAVGPADNEIFKSLENAEKINIKDLAEKLYLPVKKIVHIKDDLYIEYQIDRSSNWEETGAFTLFCNDERVEFKPGETPKSTLALDFDIYPDNQIFENQYPDALTSPEKRLER
jgi:hypothetical protein